jgi:tetratricopeptide (TPR) repeat protein
MSASILDDFPTVHRNLGIAYFNRKGDKKRALEAFYRAFYLDNTDARVLFELDQLRKRLNHSPVDRHNFLEQYPAQVDDRDDLYIEFVALQNLRGHHREAMQALEARNFHPWEGGEGKTSRQHVISCIESAKEAMRRKEYESAIGLLEAARHYPLNLGEGKLFGAQENDIYFWLGCVYECINETEKAKQYWELASEGLDEPAPAIFYNDQQPDKIFYQGLALSKLQRPQEAAQCFQNLIRYGREHMNDTVKIDYFAVSLPDLMIFDDNLDKRNREHCEYLVGLGMAGLGEADKANEHFKNVLLFDAAHQGAITHLKIVNEAQLPVYINLQERETSSVPGQAGLPR